MAVLQFAAPVFIAERFEVFPDHMVLQSLLCVLAAFLGKLAFGGQTVRMHA